MTSLVGPFLVTEIVKTLDAKALPYVLFLIVPILGRMSDPDDDVRLLSTSTFAALVKMVPLEVRFCSRTHGSALSDDFLGIRPAFPILPASLRRCL